MLESSRVKYALLAALLLAGCTPFIHRPWFIECGALQVRNPVVHHGWVEFDESCGDDQTIHIKVPVKERKP